MKAILQFNLDNLDDEMAYIRCVKSKDTAMCLWEIMHNTKKSTHAVVDCMLENNEKCSPHDAIDVVYERIYEILKENNINIEELIN